MNEISIYVHPLKNGLFQLWLLSKSDLRISPAGKQIDILELYTFKL